MKKLLITSAFAVLAVPAAAQDYDPSMAAHESMSQQQFTTQQTEISNHMLWQSIRRNRSGVTSAQIRACADNGRFRHQYGADNPKVRRLYSLCRGSGL